MDLFRGLLETIEMKQKILEAIKEYCETHTSKQREDLYAYLNEKLGLDLKVLDYKDKRTEPARFACDEEAQKWETDYVVNKILKLKED